MSFAATQRGVFPFNELDYTGESPVINLSVSVLLELLTTDPNKRSELRTLVIFRGRAARHERNACTDMCVRIVRMDPASRSRSPEVGADQAVDLLVVTDGGDRRQP